MENTTSKGELCVTKQKVIATWTDHSGQTRREYVDITHAIFDLKRLGISLMSDRMEVGGGEDCEMRFAFDVPLAPVDGSAEDTIYLI